MSVYFLPAVWRPAICIRTLTMGAESYAFRMQTVTGAKVGGCKQAYSHLHPPTDRPASGYNQVLVREL